VGRSTLPHHMLAKQGFLYLTLLSLSLPAFAVDWRPINPQDLALKQSKTDPNADAEALFRDVRIENSLIGSNQNVSITYVRFKIFTDRGREKYSDVKIEYSNKAHLSDVSGRTIHPDGTIVDLKKDAIFDKVEVKKSGLKIRVVSFALPSVEPGSLIEYRWTENKGEIIDGFNPFFPLDVQSEYPVDEVSFHLKPFASNYANLPEMRFMQFGCTPEKGDRDPQGFSSLTVRNVPAYHDEPYSPPDRSSRKWILVYYQPLTFGDNDKYWPSVGKQEYNYAKEKIKINAEIKQVAAEVTSKGNTDDEKLALLANYCRNTIKNTLGDEITTEERQQFKPNNNSADTFRQRMGNPRDIDFAFIALAQAAGYDARLALVADRRSILFSPEMQSRFFLNNADAAVQVNGKWQFFDVSDRWAPPGTLTWLEQGVWALIPDSKNSEWVQTPLLNADETRIQRMADLKLSPEGDLEGDIREIYWGNESIALRINHAKQNDSERAVAIRERIKARFAEFELTNIQVTISPDAKLPAGVKYHLLVKGYAQRTGKRLFFRPGFFTVGHRAYFSDANRTNAIYFPYPWSESDSIDIHLPDGFQPDHPEKPGPFEVPKIVKYVANLSIDNATNTLLYRRTFNFGSNVIPRFDPKNYQGVKSIFDQVHTNDEHMITLVKAAPATTQQ
jgi:transglutaminase-like putative cysteine protease